jgi:hypothetical protein
MELPYTLEAVVDEYTDDKAVLVTDDDQRLSIPKSMLSDNVTVGGVVNLAVFSDQDVATEREQFAKQILNELLGG